MGIVEAVIYKDKKENPQSRISPGNTFQAAHLISAETGWLTGVLSGSNK